jgi:hypothetical protein
MTKSTSRPPGFKTLAEFRDLERSYDQFMRGREKHLARLRKAAPDLAALVVEERITLSAALAMLDKRVA